MRFFRKSEPKERQLPAVIQQQNPTLPANATDDMVIEIWLRGRPKNTRVAYLADIAALATFTGHTSLKQLNLLQLQEWLESMAGQADASVARHARAVKSLLSFCHETGYTTFNVGAALRVPKVEEHLAERIMSEAQIHRILAYENNPRNHALLRLLYNAGLRVSEVCALTWSDLVEREQGAQIHVYGKGEKERYILMSEETYQELLAIKPRDARGEHPIFQSRKSTRGRKLTRGQVNRIVEAAAVRANVATYQEWSRAGQLVTRSRVSPHWLRHAHASHALDRKAPITLVRDTLGHKSLATTNKYSHARPDASSGTYLTI